MPTAIETIEKHMTPSLPHPAQNIYTLKYRQGHIIDELYFISKDFNSAIEEGKYYCNINPRRRFIIVRPFITDISEKIRREESIA